jgi:hypothetical protein
VSWLYIETNYTGDIYGKVDRTAENIQPRSGAPDAGGDFVCRLHFHQILVRHQYLGALHHEQKNKPPVLPSFHHDEGDPRKSGHLFGNSFNGVGLSDMGKTSAAATLRKQPARLS